MASLQLKLELELQTDKQSLDSLCHDLLHDHAGVDIICAADLVYGTQPSDKLRHLGKTFISFALEVRKL
jgi:hypothetical protein